jgi:hypothetical protein
MITIAAMMSWPAQSIAGERRETHRRRRPVLAQPAPGTSGALESARVRPTAPAQPHFFVESGPITFGDVLPGLETDVPDAMVVRVFSDRQWSLRLVPTTMLLIEGRPELISLSRLHWRSTRGGAFTAFRQNAPVVVASGKATGEAGEVVVLDLRLRLQDEDPLGQYGCSFRVELDSAL